jgi:hypothetical protein
MKFGWCDTQTVVMDNYFVVMRSGPPQVVGAAISSLFGVILFFLLLCALSLLLFLVGLAGSAAATARTTGCSGSGLLVTMQIISNCVCIFTILACKNQN